MPWENEKEFVDFFVAKLHERSRSTHVIREFRTGHGLPDLVWMDYSHEVIDGRRRRLRSRFSAEFTLDCAYAMAFLTRRRWINIENAKATLGYGNGAFARLLDVLCRRGLVEIGGEKVRALPKNKTFAVQNITVVEAKLRNWKEGVIQAQRYLWLTDDCYVLLPETRPLQTRKIVRCCEKYSVGLKFLSHTGRITSVIRLKRTRPYNTYLAWLLNESLLDEVLNGSRRFQPGHLKD